jgi:hypothetical protein
MGHAIKCVPQKPEAACRGAVSVTETVRGQRRWLWRCKIVGATCGRPHGSSSAGLRTGSRSASQQPQAADVAEGLEIVIVRQNLDVVLERDGGD